MQKASDNHRRVNEEQPGLLPAWESRPTPSASSGSKAPQGSGAPLLQRYRALQEEVARLRREHDEMHETLFAAAQVQRKLCAAREIRRGQFEIASEIFPAQYISGDFCDIVDLGAATGLAVGDIAGKGLAAGLWFIHLIGLIRCHTRSLPDPAAAMAAINRDFCQLQAEPTMTSLFLARLDPWTGDLVYCNAGQPPALLLRRDGSVDRLGEGGPPLAAVRDASYTSARLKIWPGDTLIGYSDGVVDCRNHRDEEFGEKRLLAAARKANGSTAATTLFSILGAMQDFANSHPREDDLTLMVVRCLNQAIKK